MCGRGRIGVFCVILALAAGCGKGPEQVTLPAKPAAQPAGPTTQELLDGPYKKVWLTPLALTARVPQSWDLKTPEGTTLHLLQGPGPDGQDIQISLEVGTAIKPDQLKNVLQGAQKNADKDKAHIREFKIKQIGDMQAMEEQRIFDDPSKPQEQLVDWKITCFAQRDLDLVPYVIEIGLPSARFDRCKELLQKILDSVQPERP
jgi:hypothetical protein